MFEVNRTKFSKIFYGKIKNQVPIWVKKAMDENEIEEKFAKMRESLERAKTKVPKRRRISTEVSEKAEKTLLNLEERRKAEICRL